ncbi:hypothetical protein EVAR_81349_1 [Eumeta japonica]|uniref:Uncharacterized protein n=1 Tax=Eumeta variegata TaxID=151549 RepID=A0A4C1XCN0_EUMVA|nr:hypothetical protein EVAR_81349_1 [Eumeta japonica]
MVTQMLSGNNDHFTTLSAYENIAYAQYAKELNGCTTYTGDASAIARRAQAAHGTFPERGPGTNSLPYMVRNTGRCSEGSYDVIGSQ